MHSMTIVYIIGAVLVLVQASISLELENGKIYKIEIGDDKSHKEYLTAVNNGKKCTRRADVITTGHHSSASEKAQEWKYFNKYKGKEYVVGHFGNEVSLEEKASNCKHLLQAYRLTKVKGTEYTIINLETKKCLSAVGADKRISWESCKRPEKTPKQCWTFTKVN